ncbi:SgrR family transcriptional regulator [Chengkuizengella axinellae]|uniref:ABC transporter substrate-binding protein n=1 Tax=Chengkuizengella axinellae TaxID=3064388 RepID=A0ABT9J5V9_9BACL|nr:SgrR family transcriptional regulator [Chengkuizengella sp. 2205SS18-9]MDP5276390.1 ABC transporter substrate-binding protein [Chengkuizengella sp. 2205SS18-9]
MNLIDDYIKLYSHFSEIKKDEKLELSLEVVSRIFFCTTRNSRLILKKMEDEHWLVWYPGRGRGNRSKITFLVEPSDLIFDRSVTIVKSGELIDAKAYIQKYKIRFPSVYKQFHLWIDTVFGYHSVSFDQKKMDTLRFKVSVLPINRLDPIHVSLRSESHIVKQICDTLVCFNAEAEEIEPHIAFYWETNQDAKEWTFYLRKGIKFHNGELLTASDVYYTFQRFRNDSHNLHGWMLEDVKDIEVLDEYTIQVRLYHENHLFLHILSDEHLSILSCQNEAVHSNDFLIGSGPFKLIRNDESMLVLEANDVYFRERPFLDRVELWNFTDDFNLKDQKLNEVLYTPHAHHQIKGHVDPNWRDTALNEWNVQYVTFNLNKHGPIQNIYFRKALQSIMNRVDLMKALGGSRNEAANNLLPVISREYEYSNHEEVNELIKKSGYNGERLKLYTFADQDHVEDCSWIQEQCDKVGIWIQPSYLEADVLLQPRILKEADILHDSANFNEQFELCFLHMLLTKNSFLYTHLTSSFKEEIRRKSLKIYQTKVQKDRIQLLQEIENELLEKMNIIPLYRNKVNVQSHSMVQNVSLNLQGWLDFYGIWFKRILKN